MISWLGRGCAFALLFALAGGVSWLALPSKLEGLWLVATPSMASRVSSPCRRGALGSTAPRRPSRATGAQHVPYERTVQVAEPFQPKLDASEAVLVEVAQAHYGRPPTFACRTARGRSHRLSEHARGNAIDVRGFSFRAMRRGEPALDSLPAGPSSSP